MKLLITGCYRVGSEYIAQIINNSSDICVEMYITNFFRNYYDDYNPISKKINYSRAVFDIGKRMRVRWGRKLNVHKVVDTLNEKDNAKYKVVYDKVMKNIIQDGSSEWGEKMQLEWRSIPTFMDMFEDGKAVLSVRDPRSVLASFKEYTYSEHPRYLGAIFNCLDSMRKGIIYKNSIGGRCFIVKYEDVVRDSESTVLNLLESLGLSTDHNLLSQEDWTDTSGNEWHTNSAFATDKNFDEEAALNRWVDNLDPWEIALCERVNRDMMKAYGYELTNVSVPESEYLDVIDEDEQIASFFERWRRTGEGVEQYPTDPTDPGNWAENN